MPYHDLRHFNLVIKYVLLCFADTVTTAHYSLSHWCFAFSPAHYDTAFCLSRRAAPNTAITPRSIVFVQCV